LGSILQIASTEITTFATTTLIDPAFATLLTLPIETHGGDVLALFSVAVVAVTGATLNNPEFRLVVDGALYGSTSACLFGALPNAAALDWLVPGLAPGVHTFEIEWAKYPGSDVPTTLVVAPSLAPNGQHASFVLLEFVP
jgi:hypothetical protein